MSLDERQKVVKKTFTRKQIEGMSVEDVVALVGEAGPGARFHGSGVVRKANGEIRYDAEAVPGTFGETPEELAAPSAVKQTEVLLDRAEKTDD